MVLPFKLSDKFIPTFLAALSWAVSIVLARIILKDGESVYSLLLWTTLLATPYWLYLFSRQKEEAQKLTKKDITILLCMGLISAAGVNLVEVLALKYTTALNFALLIRSVVFFSIVFAFLFVGEKITLKKGILVGMILVGTYFFVTNGAHITFSKGDILTLVEAALIAFGNNTLGKISTNRMSSSLSSSATFLIGVVPIVLFAIFNKALAFPQAVFLVLLLTISNISIVYFRFRAYKKATVSYVTMIFSLTPILVLLLAVPLLGETITLMQAIGGMFIITAGIFVEKLKI